MKKILFLLLLSTVTYGQVSNGQEQEFDYGIKNNAATTVLVPNYVTTQGADGTYGKIEPINLPVSTATQDSLNKKLNISDVPSNLTLYATNVAADIGGYFKLVNSISDPEYNVTAVDISTGAIATTSQLISSGVAPIGLITGQPGVINVTTVGNIKRLSGTGTASFYFQIFHRTSAGVETLIGTSSATLAVSSSTYQEFSTTAIWNDGIFLPTDRVVIKFYANRVPGNSDPTYNFQFGGAMPVRSIVPVPFSVVAGEYELKVNKQNSLATDGTGIKYPTVDAINASLPVNYAKVVYVNAINPTTATIFDLNNPPTINDNLLKNDVNNLYIGTDVSTWVYNGSTYVTKVVPLSSNFYLSGTTTDAGNNKTSAIKRNNTIESTGFIKTGGTSAQFLKANGAVDSNIYAPSIGSTSYIQNQNASAQSANMWISGKLSFTYGSDTVPFFTFGNFASYGWGFLERATEGNFDIKRTQNSISYSVLTLSRATGAATFASSVTATSFNGSATLTGTPTAPTAAVGTNTTQIATTAFVLANGATANGFLKTYTGASIGGGLTFISDKSDVVSKFSISTKFINNTSNGDNNNSSFGNQSAMNLTTGTYNATLGLYSLAGTTTGSNNIAIGTSAGYTYTGGFGLLNPNESIFIGNNTVSLANNQTNEIVIGTSATGYGSNTVTLGSSSIVKTVLRGVISHTTSYTVAMLPVGALGDTTYVTDATAPTYLGVLTGGGAVVCPVFYNGTAWIAH